jgi:hypothetical protein
MSTKYAGLTLKTNPVALQTVHGLSEEVLSNGGHSGDIVLVPLNGGVDVFKYLLDGVGDFSSDTVTWNQGDLCHVKPSMSLRWGDTDRHSRCKHLHTWSEAIHRRRNQFYAVSEWLQAILFVILVGNRQRG